jgi:hypothetical protein
VRQIGHEIATQTVGRLQSLTHRVEGVSERSDRGRPGRSDSNGVVAGRDPIGGIHHFHQRREESSRPASGRDDNANGHEDNDGHEQRQAEWQPRNQLVSLRQQPGNGNNNREQKEECGESSDGNPPKEADSPLSIRAEGARLRRPGLIRRPPRRAMMSPTRVVHWSVNL